MESSTELDTVWLGRLLKRNYKENEPADIIDVHVDYAVPSGENYLSIVMRVKMDIITKAGSKKTSSIIVKVAKQSEESAKVSQVFSSFRNETKMYTTTLKQMEALMNEFEDKRGTLWPKLYGFEPYSIMALEDLTETNFSMIDRRGWQDLDHSLLVLRCIGRYHAMTKVLMSRGLINNDEKGRFFAGPKSDFKNCLFNSSLHMLSKVILKKKGLWSKGWEDVGNRIKNQIGVLPDTLETLYNDYNKEFDVLNHGDMWSSNMMFKTMEYTNIPIAVKFVDYQIPHLNSFIWDVTYFMYTSIKPSVRRPNVDHLLKAYHQSLVDNLVFFKWEGYVPSLSDVKCEASRLLPAAFAFVTTIMAVTTANVKDPLVMENVLTHPPEEIFNENIYTDEKFVKEIGDDLNNFVKLGVI